MTFEEFEQNYFDLISDPKIGNTYRFGQHFINSFIKDSSTPRFQKLWNERNFKLAKFEICEYINEVHWDYNDLPLLEKHYDK